MKSMSTQTTEKRVSQLKKVTRAGLLLLGLLCLIVVLFVLRFRTKQISVKAGDVFPSNITAPFTGTDSFLTDKARQKARESTPVIYETSEALVKERKTAIEAWFTNFEGWLADMASVWEQDAEILENKYRFRGLNTRWKELVPELEMAQALVRRGISEEITVTVSYLILDKYMPAGAAHPLGEIVNAADFKKAFTETVYPLLEAGTEEKSLSKTQANALTAIKKKSLLSALKTEVAGKLVEKYLQPTVGIDKETTEENRRLAAATVADVRISRGEVLYKKGDPVKAEDITHLTSLGLLKGAGSETTFSFTALFIYAVLCVFVTGLWLVLFEKRVLLRTGAMCATVTIYAITALLAYAFSYFKAELAPVLLALLCAAEDGKKEHTAGALFFSALLLPVLLDTDAPFGAEGLITGASLCMGGFCACSMLHIIKSEKVNPLPAGMAGGTVIGIVRLCPLLWEGASGVSLAVGFGLPFLGGLIAAILTVLLRPLLRRMHELDGI